MMIRILIFMVVLNVVGCTTPKSMVVSRLKQGTILTKVEKKSETSINSIPIKLIYYQAQKKERIIVEIEKNMLSITPLRSDFDSFPVLTFKDSLSHRVDQTKHHIPYKFEYNALFNKLDTSKTVEPKFNGPTENTDPYLDYYHIASKTTYYQSNQSVQALTIPFKLRPATNEIEYQLSTGINVGIGYTFKEIIKTYQPISKGPTTTPIGYKESKFEFGISPFIGLTAVDLTSITTESAIESDKKVLGATLGFLLSIDINGIDLGVSVGLDKAFDSSARYWVYDGKPWFGLGVGLDIVK